MTFKLCKIKQVMLSASVVTLAGVVAAVVLSLAGTAVSAAVIKGDANGDGAVTIDDVTCIQKYLVGQPAGEGFSEAAADVDRNGVLDIIDATIIQRWLTYKETHYPIGVQPTEAQTQFPTDEEGWGRDIFRP